MSRSGQVLAAMLVACVAGSAVAQGYGLRPDPVPAFGLRGGLDTRTVRSPSDVFAQNLTSSNDAGLILADWHPLDSGFRLTGGLAYNNPRFESVSYSGRSVSMTGYETSVGSTTTFRSLWTRSNPYFGLGWGVAPTARSGLYMSADVGVMYQRAGGGNCSLALPPMMCAQLQSDLRLDDEARVAPVLSLGVGLRF